MGLQAILDAIHRAGDEQVKEIEARTQVEVARILAQADREADAIRREACQSELNFAARERARIVQQAHGTRLRLLEDAHQKFVNEVLDCTRVRLEGLRTDPRYADLLRRLISEALSTLQGILEVSEKPCIEANQQDEPLLENIVSDIGIPLVITYSLQAGNGIIARSQDGRIVVDNRFETRLERAKLHLYHILVRAAEGELLSHVWL